MYPPRPRRRPGRTALSAPDALAASAGPVQPGVYEIVNARGDCLRGEGDFNAKALVGTRDTRWEVARGAEHDGFVITRATTANCLAHALELIYPPWAATLPCDLARASLWTFTDAGERRVTSPSPTSPTEAVTGEPSSCCPPARRAAVDPQAGVTFRRRQ
ncbi:hypothetical protein [Streptosporangium sp. NPDC049304]|uniref:hypothetical protein n=1 Tax=Streptosporangium sp. NPDC049304 TaxID=3154830 RepID=UPI00341DD692